MAMQGEGKPAACGSPLTNETSSSVVRCKRRGPSGAAEPSSSAALAARGKGKQLPPRPTSGSGLGGKRCSPEHDEELLSSSSAASKRHHRLSVPQFRVASARVSDEREEGEDVESEEDLDDGGMGTLETQGRARTGEGPIAAGAVGPQEHQLQSKILLSEIMKLKKNDEQLVPFADFLRLVKEITGRHSREVSHWTPKALLSLHEVVMDSLVAIVQPTDVGSPALL